MALVAKLAPERPALFVARLLVDPEARRQGVGRNLLEQARRAAVESGHCPMLDVVETPKAEAAISLYRGVAGRRSDGCHPADLVRRLTNSSSVVPSADHRAVSRRLVTP